MQTASFDNSSNVITCQSSHLTQFSVILAPVIVPPPPNNGTGQSNNNTAGNN